MTMQQCEQLIDLLDGNGIDTEIYKWQFCELIAIPPSERFWDELLEDLQVEVMAMDLVNEHPDSYSIHHDIKLCMNKESLRALLEAGYQDCTSHNDETPSYYDGKKIIYIYNPLNEFKVTDIDGEHIDTFNTIKQAISA